MTTNKDEDQFDILRTFSPEDVWFTSDTHFWHENILRYCNRPFKTIRDFINFNEFVGSVTGKIIRY